MKFIDFLVRIHNIAFDFFELICRGYIKYYACKYFPSLRGRPGYKVYSQDGRDTRDEEYENWKDAKSVIHKRGRKLTLFPFIAVSFYILIKFSLFDIIKYIFR